MTYAEQLTIDAAANRAVFMVLGFLLICVSYALAHLAVMYYAKKRSYKRLEQRCQSQQTRFKAELQDRDTIIQRLTIEKGDVEFLKKQMRGVQADNDTLLKRTKRYLAERDKSDKKLKEMIDKTRKFFDNIPTVTDHVDIQL